MLLLVLVLVLVLAFAAVLADGAAGFPHLRDQGVVVQVVAQCAGPDVVEWEERVMLKS